MFPFVKKQADADGRAAEAACERELQDAFEDDPKAKRAGIMRPRRTGDVASLLGYECMFQDGICKIEEGLYSTTLSWGDISYQELKLADQEDILEVWEQTLNALDPATEIELTFLTKRMERAKFSKRMFLALDADETYNAYRREINSIIADKVAGADHDFEHMRWITLTQAQPTHADATRELTQARESLMRDLDELGSDSQVLTGKERLEALHQILCPGDGELKFSYDDLAGTALTTKDYIAPTCMNLDGKNLEFGEYYGRVLVVEKMVRSVRDTFLAELINMPFDMAISMHIQQIEQDKAIDMIARRETDLKAEIATQTRKLAAKNIYSEDMLVPELVESRITASELRDDLVNKDQHFFKLTIVLFPFSKDTDELKVNVEHVKKCGRKHSITIGEPVGMRRAGLKSVLPIGRNWIPIERQLTTSPLAALAPFTSEELIVEGGAFYGINQLSGNPIIFSRKSLGATGGAIVGMPNAGKSFFAKLCIIQEILNDPMAHFDIIDPEREFSYLASAFGGVIVPLGANSDVHINPFDLDMDYSDDEDPLKVKMSFIFSLIGFMAGHLSEKQMSIVDRVTRLIYQPFFKSKDKADLPLLGDFHEELKKQKEIEAKDLATTIERYVEGTMSVFNHRTNVDLDNRLIVWDTRDLGKDMRNIGLLIALDAVWNRVVANREAGARTYFYVDEWQLLLSSEYAISFFDELWTRARKWGAIPTIITQNLTRVLENDHAAKLISNSDFLLLLRQSDPDSRAAQKMLSLSARQMKFIRGKNRKPGTGLLVAEQRYIPFNNRYPEDSEIYRICDTKFKDTEIDDFGDFGIDVAKAV